MMLASNTSQPAAQKKNAQEGDDKTETQEVTARDFHEKGETTIKNKKLKGFSEWLAYTTFYIQHKY